jgi:hypothetical protein
VKTRKPMIHGLAKSQPVSASFTAGRNIGRGAVVRARSMVADMACSFFRLQVADCRLRIGPVRSGASGAAMEPQRAVQSDPAPGCHHAARR